MSRKIFIYWSLLFLLAISCKDKKSFTVIELDPNNGKILTSDDIQINKVVPLKHKTTPIGEVVKVITYNEKIFIQDEMKNSSVFCFDLEGNYLYHLSSGRGPGEFLIPEDFVIHDDQLIVFDSWGNKVFYYSINGDYLESKNALVRIQNVDIFNDLLLVRPYIYGPEDLEKNHNLIITDIYFNNIISNHLPGLHRSEDISFSRVFSNYYNNHILHSYGFNDTIYEVKTNQIKPYIYVDFKGEKIPEKLINAGTSMELKEVRMEFSNKNYASRIFKILENRKYISFDYRHGRVIKHAICSKNTSQPIIHNVYEIRNDSLGVNIPFPSYVHDEQYVSVVFSDDMDEDSPLKNEINDYAYLVLYEYKL